MTNTLIAIGYFFLSVYNDDLNVRWHDAREKNQPARGGNISLAMGIVAWLPFILLVTTWNWQIVVADLAGNWVGSYWGIKRMHENNNKETGDEESSRSSG